MLERCEVEKSAEVVALARVVLPPVMVNVQRAAEAKAHVVVPPALNDGLL